MCQCLDEKCIDASHLSCQGLTYCEDDDNGWVRHHGQLIAGYGREMARRGEDHVYSCNLVGHIPGEDD